MKKRDHNRQPIKWRDLAATRWPGFVAIAAYLVGFFVFPFWGWLLLAPLLAGLFKLLKADDWPALVTAGLYVLCFPHARLGFLAFVCFVPLLWKMPTATGRRMLRLGWIAGTLGNIGKLYWLVYTISYFSPIPFPVAVAILLLLCSTLGLFWGLHFHLTGWATNRYRLPLWLVFPVGWVFWDHFLTWFLGGFPWEVLGNAAFHLPYFDQTVDLIGALSLGFVFAFGSVAVTELIRYARKQRPFPKMQTAVLVVLVAGGFIYGAIRGAQIERLSRQGTPISIGVLQGNVDQSVKWKPGSRDRIMRDYLNLARRVADEGVDLIVFPETSIPRHQERWKPMEDEITQYAVETQHYALVGVGTRVKRLYADRLRGPIQRHNSAVLLAPDGTDLAWYDKNRLVPFGEYIPKKHWMQLFSKKPIKGTLNFEPSGRYTLMPFPKAPFAVFICYEAVYPSTVRRLTNLGAKFLVTITNDAWFGATSAPYQHWDQVAIRAIENRRWVARAANTGISGFIDPLGRTVIATPIYVDAKVVGTVRPLDVQTLYARIGDVVAYACIAVYWGLLGYALWRQKARKEKTA